MVRKTDSDAVFKQQANRLRAFLKRGGHDLQHAHALEAIAAVHGAKDFHTLSHNAQKSSLAPMYVVNLWGAGDWVDSAVTADYQLALACFMQNVRFYSDLFPEKTVSVAAVQGGVRTEGLLCYLGETLVVSLTQASVIQPPMDGKRMDLLPANYEWQDIADLAYEVTAVLASRQDGDWEWRLRKAENSSVALTLSADPASEIYTQVAEIYADAAIDPMRHLEVRDLLDSAKVTLSMAVLVKEGGVIEL